MEDYANVARVRGPVFDGRRLSRLPLSIAVAGGISVPALRIWQSVDSSCHLVPVFELRLPDLGDCRHRIPRHAEASDHVVSGDMVCDLWLSENSYRADCLGDGELIGDLWK
jgi:hypothetical protein